MAQPRAITLGPARGMMREVSASSSPPGGDAARSGAALDATIDATNASASSATLAVDSHEAVARGAQVGRYVILDRIGVGAMGLVYAAFDPALDRKIALKLLRPRVGGDRPEEASVRLAREARAMARLDHPNVVTVHDVGTFDGQVFVAMEFIEGTTLRQWMQSPRTWREIVAVFLAAGEGLAAAHEVGMVHRDFKPDNVMVSPGTDATPRVRVLDFGLAHQPGEPGMMGSREDVPLDDPVGRVISDSSVLEHDLTKTGALLGTPGYMSPEQFEGAPASAASDQFAFCVALHEALFGQLPFAGDSVPALAAAVADGRRRPVPAGIRLPRALVAAIDRGLATQAHQRWPRMRALLERLRRISAGRRRGELAVLGVVALGCAGAIYAGSRTPPPCPIANEAVAGIWDPPRREQILAGLRATGLAYAEDSAQFLVARVDPWVDAWLAARVDACEATHVRHEQSEQVLDRRMQCLDRRLGDLAGTLDVIAAGEAGVIAQVPDLVRTLGDLERCSDVEALAAVVPPPDDADARAHDERIVAAISRAYATWISGDSPGALAQLDGLRDEAVALGYRPTLALLEHRRAEALWSLDRPDEARAAAMEAVWLAHAAGDRFEEAASSIELVEILAESRRFDEADLWTRHAGADLERNAGVPELQWQFSTAMGRLAMVRERFGEARTHFERAHALCVESAGDEACLALLGRLGQVEHAAGNYEAALAIHREVLAAERAALGSSHPSVGASLNNLGILLRALGRLDEALVCFDEAEAIYAAIDPEHPILARLANNRAVVHLYRHEFAKAERDFTAAFEGMRDQLGADHPLLPGIEGNVAMAIFAQGRHDEALAIHRRVLAQNLAIYGEDNLDVADTHANIGDVLSELARWDEAEAEYAHALGIRERMLGANHGDTARARCNVGATLQARGRSAEALVAFEACHTGFVAAFGAEDAQVANPELGRGEAEFALGRTAEGVARLEHALVLAGDGDPMLRAQIRFALGRAQAELGRSTEARDHVDAAARAFAEVGGNWSDDARAAATWLRTHRG